MPPGRACTAIYSNCLGCCCELNSLLSACGQEADTEDRMSEGHGGARGTLLAEHHRTGDQGDTS